MRLAETLTYNGGSLNSYQNLAAKTAKYTDNTDGIPWIGLSYLTMKLTGEAGEFSEKMGKLVRDTPYWREQTQNWPVETKEALKKELGDVLWYVANLSQELGYSLQNVAEANLEKLESRKERGVIGGSGDNR